MALKGWLPLAAWREVRRRRFPKRILAAMMLTGVVVGGVFGILGLEFARTLPAGRKWIAWTLVYLGVAGIVVLQRLLRGQVIARVEQERDAEAAREIQTRLRPLVLPQPPGFELAGYYRSYQQVGGDYYDTLPLKDGRLLLTIADVSGKGVAAALLTANLQAILKFADLDERSLERVVSAINVHLCRHTEANRFITMLLGVLDLAGRRFTYVNAGHTPGFLARRGKMIRLEATAPPLGMIEEMRFPCSDTLLEPGDAMVFYTDGLSERSNPQGKFFEEEGIAAALERGGSGSAEAIVQRLVDDCEAFARGQPADDDTAILVIRAKDSPAAGPA